MTAPPDAHDLTGHLHPGDVRWPARGADRARPLHDVGAVDPGGAHLDEELGVARRRVVSFLVDEVAVPDDHGVHAGHPRPVRVSDRSAAPERDGRGAR